MDNTLFAIKAFDKLESKLSTVRSLLLTGPNHPYPLRSFSDCYKMLRVLNALSIRFYEFPIEILHLTLLRYLSLTLNGGKLPTGISKLRKLQFLIVHLHQIVRSWEGIPTYLPMEIWAMGRLIHLQVMGSDLPVPSHPDALLPNLSTLMDVSPHSCTKEVLERISNLKELIISINLEPKTNAPLSCPFDHLVLLEKLQWLNCTITNPYFESYPQPHVVPIPQRVSASMNGLTTLTLSRCGFPWESINQISQWPYLEALELRCHAFHGPKWEATNTGFKRLNILLLEDLDLVYWTSRSGEFLPGLVILKIIRCHKLEHIPQIGHQDRLETIEVVDSSSAVETWARSMRMKRCRRGQIFARDF